MKEETRPPNFTWSHYENGDSKLWASGVLIGYAESRHSCWVGRAFVGGVTVNLGGRIRRQNAIDLVEQFWRAAAKTAKELGLVHAHVDGEDVCVPCGHRLLLDHLRLQPFNLRPCNGWDDERLERLLTKAVEA